MPITLLPNRRTVLASASLLVFRPQFALAAESDPHRIALLSDSHIGEKPEATDRDCNVHGRLKQVAAEVAKLTPRPVCSR